MIVTGLGPGRYAFGNMGDVAMVQSCLSRLKKLWPSAALTVLSDAPQDLIRFCPGAAPLSTVGRNLLYGENLLLGRFERYLPGWLKYLAIRIKKKGVYCPTILKWCLVARLSVRRRRDEMGAIIAFLKAFAGTDLLVVSGAGGFYYNCPDWNAETLDTIEAAVARDIPVIMFGQHFGPLVDPAILSRAKRVLPKVDLIALRGNPGALALLETLGVHPSRIIVTGDEAIETAYQARPGNPGLHLGVNIRFGGSAETNLSEIAKLKPIVQQFASSHNIRLIPVPIAVDSWTCDPKPIATIMRDLDDQSDGGACLGSPLEIINQVGRCRVLVTCAYHAAVFALAQGIPAIALVKSRYYAEKFAGLKDMFGIGIEIVYFDCLDTPVGLREIIEGVWQSAPEMRIPLQDAAVRQIRLIREAYARAKSIMANHVA